MLPTAKGPTGPKNIDIPTLIAGSKAPVDSMPLSKARYLPMARTFPFINSNCWFACNSSSVFCFEIAPITPDGSFLISSLNSFGLRSKKLTFLSEVVRGSVKRGDKVSDSSFPDCRGENIGNIICR